jgi:hypothetical protein
MIDTNNTPPPTDWYDRVMVDRALNHQWHLLNRQLSRRELQEVVGIFLDRSYERKLDGLSPQESALDLLRETLHIAPETIRNIRDAVRPGHLERMREAEAESLSTKNLWLLAGYASAQRSRKQAA